MLLSRYLKIYPCNDLPNHTLLYSTNKGSICRLLTMLKNGIIDEVDCRKDFYDAGLERMVLQNVQVRG